MRKCSVLLIAMTILLGSANVVRADDASHEKAVKKLFEVMQMKKTMDASITKMLDLQIEQQPMLAKYRPVMMKFFAKYMSWEVMEPEMTKLYKDSFTESEINDLVSFYQSPTGKKSADILPDLMAKGAAIGQNLVQKNMGELQQMIRDFDAGKQP